MEDLARLSIKNKPVYVGVDDAEQESTVDGLEQVNELVTPRLAVFLFIMYLVDFGCAFLLCVRCVRLGLFLFNPSFPS